MLVFGRPNKKLKKYAAARKPYEAWERVAKSADWKKFADVKQTRNDADKVGACYVFNIGGNKSRLITAITFATDSKPGIVLVHDLLTHGQYDKDGWKGDC